MSGKNKERLQERKHTPILPTEVVRTGYEAASPSRLDLDSFNVCDRDVPNIDPPRLPLFELLRLARSRKNTVIEQLVGCIELLGGTDFVEHWPEDVGGVDDGEVPRKLVLVVSIEVPCG